MRIHRTPARRMTGLLRTVVVAMSVTAAAAATTLAAPVAVARPGDIHGPDVTIASCPVPPGHDPAVINTVLAVGLQRGVNDKVLLAAFEAGWVESHMNNLACGDRDSLGVFQQRPSQGWGTPTQIMNVAYAAGKFYQYAVPNDRANPGFTAGQLAQSVQRSAFPARYDQAESKARALIAEARGQLRRGVERDYSGDGFGDLVVVPVDGHLDYYPNNSAGGGDLFRSAIRSPAPSWGGATAMSGGDVSGDGVSDLMVVTADGHLDYYPNNAASNPGGAPFTSAAWRSPSPSWSGTTFIGTGDISGDRVADLMAIGADGHLYHYPNNAASNPGGAPFTTAAARSTAATWGTMTAFSVGDLNRDGFADLLVVAPDGHLYGYHNNGRAGLGELPFTTAAWRSPAPSWGDVTSISATDISGDGFADLLMVAPDGHLYYYPNNSTSNPGGMPFTSAGWRSPGPTFTGAELA